MREPAASSLPRAFTPTRLALLAAAFGIASGLAACGKPAEAQGGPPPAMPVSVAPAVQRSVSDNE